MRDRLLLVKQTIKCSEIFTSAFRFEANRLLQESFKQLVNYLEKFIKSSFPYQLTRKIELCKKKKKKEIKRWKRDCYNNDYRDIDLPKK